ncbi:hypothetical protein AOLI_G00256880 [Acnodon oligacanthus]
MSDTKVKVAVRVRPMNRREIELSTKCVVEMEENQTILHPPPSNTKGDSRMSFWCRREKVRELSHFTGSKQVLQCHLEKSDEGKCHFSSLLVWG